MFADDTKCYNTICSQDDVTHLQHDLQSIFNWALQNELSFQPLNLLISHKRNSIDRSYFLHDVQLKTVGASRDLGILVSKNLHWADYINSIIAKANKMFGFLRRNCSRHQTLDTQRTLCLPCTLSLNICLSGVVSDLLRLSFTVPYIRNLERVQRRTTPVIMRNPELSFKSRLLALKLLKEK